MEFDLANIFFFAGGLLFFALIVYLVWELRRGRNLRLVKSQHSVDRRSTISSSTDPFGSVDSKPLEEVDLLLSNLEKKIGIVVGKSIFHGLSAESRISQIRNRLKRINSALPDTGRATVSESTAEIREELPYLPDLQPEPEQYSFYKSFAGNLVESYNLARSDRSARNSFWSEFQAEQIGNRNATEQRMGRASSSDFRTSSPGDFLAVPDKDLAGYLVVPNFATVVDETSVRYGGIGEAFDIQIMPGSSFQNFRLLEPARFSKNGDSWVLTSPGRIDLMA